MKEKSAMQQTDINIFLQSLRGNQPMIILAFLLVRSALHIEQLENITGLHSDTVRSAVKGLASKGLIFKQVGEHGRASWLPAGDTFFGRFFDQSPKTSDSDVLIVVNVESEESEKLKLTTSTNRTQSPKTSDSGETILSITTIVKDESDIEACLATLNAAGIYGKKAKEIAEDWHIMVNDIQAHLAWVKSESWGNPHGMAIYRLLNHVVPPPLQENGHILDCRCRECQTAKFQKRYTDSDFHQHINRVNRDTKEKP